MMLHIPQILTKQQVAELRQQLDASHSWIEGHQSAGSQAQKIKKIYNLILIALLIKLLPQ